MPPPRKGDAPVRRLMDRAELATLAVSLGGVETLSSSTPPPWPHAGSSRDERERAGITDGVVRFSVGSEDIEQALHD